MSALTTTLETPASAPAEIPSGSSPAIAVRVLHLYAGNLYGGIETMLRTLARCGHLEPSLHMEFALCFPGRLRDELETAAATVHDLGPVQFRRPWTILRARRRLSRLLRRQKFDVVILHACWPHALFAATARRGGARIVFWQHDFVGSGHWIERLAALTPPNQIISNSHASAATLPKLFPGVPHEVIYCPVEPPIPPADPAAERREIRRELQTPDDAIVIIQASRMERWKGHTLLLDALGQLRDQPNWVAWIVGGAQRPHEHAYLAELKTQATNLGIADRIRFLGQRLDVPCLLAAADIYCQPNLSPEPFGIAFIEAMYAGLPVITTLMGGGAEIVSTNCGKLFDITNRQNLRECLRELMYFSDHRSLLGKAGLLRSEYLCGLYQGMKLIKNTFLRL